MDGVEIFITKYTEQLNQNILRKDATKISFTNFKAQIDDLEFQIANGSNADITK